LSDTRYSFISAYLKGGESKVMTSAHINRISRTSAIQDVLMAIEGTEVGDYLAELAVDTFDEVDEHLWGHFGHCINRIEAFRFIPGDVTRILRVYLKKYDVHNIKAALQQLYSGRSTRMIPLGVIHHYDMLAKLSEAATPDDIMAVLINCGLTDYVPIVHGYSTENEAKSNTATRSGLDAIYYAELLSISKTVKDGHILSHAFGLIIDMTNLMIAMRAVIAGMGTEVAGNIIPSGYLLPGAEARDLLSTKLTDLPGKLTNPIYREIADEVVADYGRNHEISSVSETIDKHRLALIGGLLSPRVMSPLSMVWYLIVKETEIRNLRLVMKAVLDNRDIDEIKNHLVFAS